MGLSEHDQPPQGTPPGYYESTTSRMAPGQSSSNGAQPAAFMTSGGWVPPAGNWQPASTSSSNNPGGSYSNVGQSVMKPPRQSTSSDRSEEEYRGDEKRSSGFFGGSKKKDKSRMKEKDGAGSSSSSFVSPPQPATTKKGRQPPLPPSEEDLMRAYISRIPSTAQKALAPLAITSDTKDILGVYAVELSNSAPTYVPASNGSSIQISQTCFFESTGRNDIDITLYLKPNPEVLKQQMELADARRRTNTNPFSQGPPPLPIRNNNHVPLEILAKNKKGRIKLSIPERFPNRALRIICNLESHVNMQLPLGFKGKLAIWAPGGHIELSEPLRQNSTIIPSTTGNTQVTVYKIVPSGSADVGGGSGETFQEQGGTMDLCQLNTTKGRVKVEYAKPPKGGQGGGDCLVM